jgi:hypothetical protein
MFTDIWSFILMSYGSKQNRCIKAQIIIRKWMRVLSNLSPIYDTLSTLTMSHTAFIWDSRHYSVMQSNTKCFDLVQFNAITFPFQKLLKVNWSGIAREFSQRQSTMICDFEYSVDHYSWKSSFSRKWTEIMCFQLRFLFLPLFCHRSDIGCSTQPWASRDWPYIMQFYWRDGIV